MSKRAIDFVNGWVFENINAGPYDPGDAVVNSHVEQLLMDARAEGISKEEIEEDMGVVTDVISTALEEATDNEVERLASRND